MKRQGVSFIRVCCIIVGLGVVVGVIEVVDGFVIRVIVIWGVIG